MSYGQSMNDKNSDDMAQRFAQELANLIDDVSGPDGQWNGGDIVHEVARFIQERGGWSVCDVDGLVYSSAKRSCPFCDPSGLEP